MARGRIYDSSSNFVGSPEKARTGFTKVVQERSSSVVRVPTAAWTKLANI